MTRLFCLLLTLLFSLSSPAIGKYSDFGQSSLAAKSGSNIVYRGLTEADAAAIAAGRGLTAKAPGGTWTAAEHVANAGPGVGGARMNSPWISTSRRLDVAQAYDSGHGVIAMEPKGQAS